MRIQFDEEITRIKEISKRNKLRASKMLDDMGTAYISAEAFDHLDKSLIAVRVAKKALRAQGITQNLIDDYFLEYSYLSKTQLKKIRNDSLDSSDRADELQDIRPALYSKSGAGATDLIIEELQSRPKLLNALKRNMRKDQIKRDFNITCATRLKNFYEQHKSILDI